MTDEEYTALDAETRFRYTVMILTLFLGAIVALIVGSLHAGVLWTLVVFFGVTVPSFTYWTISEVRYARETRRRRSLK